MRRKICVIGAGIIGVSTAVCIQERIPNVEVTIMAAEFSPNLTSDVAAGFIQPYLCPGDDPKKVNEWFRLTMQHIRNYMKEVPNGGAQNMSGYFFQKNTYETPFWAEVMSNFRRLTPVELAEKHPLPQKSGFFYTTLYMQPTKHIAWLMEKFHRNGGEIIQRQLKSFQDVGNDWDVVVNCSGIGAKNLTGDENLVPVRGQIIRVRAPQVKHFFMDDDFHTLLNDETVTLGGTKGVNQWHLTVDDETIPKILEGNIKRIPALKDAEILSHHVGLRPSRPNVPLVHNYGHGGSGITLFWGTAVDATKLVENSLMMAKL